MPRYDRPPAAYNGGQRPSSMGLGGGGGGYIGPYVDYDDSSDDVTYDIDHLVTYTVSPHRGLSSPNDAFTRLRRMALTTGVWTKRLRMRVGVRDLVVVDGRDPVERFPLRLVGGLSGDEVVASSVCDGFENVVAFTVAGDDLLRRPAEIHLFQCVGRPGQDMVNDIKAAKTGQPLPRQSVTQQQYPSNEPGQSYNDRTTNNVVETSQQDTAGNSASSLNSPMPAEDRSYEAKIMDNVFTEIEEFVAMLQRAASDAKDASVAEGMRQKPPEAKDFFAILQKIKFCIILLSRLKHDIRDPNASELVRSLFVPLQLIADACRSGEGLPQLTTQVVSPLLTPDAIDLLNNCLASKEMELWNSLGPAWNTSRNNWSGNVSYYHLVLKAAPTPSKVWLDDVIQQPSQMPDDAPHFSGPVNGSVNVDVHSPPTSSTDSPNAVKTQDEFLRDLQAQNIPVWIITRHRDAMNERELTVNAEDVVQVLDNTRNWWKVQNFRGEVGYVPNTILRSQQ